MGHWNYRVTRHQVETVDGYVTVYDLREVHYNDDGTVRAWTAEPVTFEGDTPGEVAEALLLATKAYPTRGVLDLDTRETVKVPHHASEQSAGDPR